MIIQIQNATLDTSNTDSYGSGQAGGYGSGWLNYGNSGQYELATVVDYNAPTLVISENLTNNFVVNSQSSYQVVRVPMYEDVRLTGTITAADWNGSSGGIVALFVNGSLDLNGNTIDVNGKGFRGGKLNTSNGIATGLNYVLSASNIDGGKGEGIAYIHRLHLEVMVIPMVIMVLVLQPMLVVAVISTLVVVVAPMSALVAEAVIMETQ